MLSRIFKYDYNNDHLVMTIFNFIKFKIKNTNLSNKIFIISNGIEKQVNINKIKGLKIVIKGSNNIIKIHKPYNFNNSKLLICGDNNFFECYENKKMINNTTFNMQFNNKNRKIIIGKNTYIGEALLINNNSFSTISIGNNCMLSADIHIRTNDGHIICQKGTKNIINQGGNVIIGEHCWIGRKVFISKNVFIPDNTIIGAGSIVTKCFKDTNTVIAGVPAKVVKRDVDWYYNKKELDESEN